MLLLLAQGAQPEHRGGEVNLVVPDLSRVTFLGGISGPSSLMGGLLIALLGMVFGLLIYKRLRDLAVHASMREISELIYETCKTYLQTQGRFLMILEIFIGTAIIFYFGFLQRLEVYRVVIILVFSIIGILGSYSVAWFGIRVNTFANSRTAFASLRGKPYPCYYIPLEAGMSIGMLLISVELFIMLCILLFIPGELAGPCFIGFAIGESLGAAALRVAGWIFTENAAKMNFETPLTSLVWLTSIISIILTFILSKMLIPDIGGDPSLWWKLSLVITCGTAAGAIIPEFVKVFTSTDSRHVREVVTASREGGASLNILSGFIAGNFSAYWLGLTILVLMGAGYVISTSIPPEMMLA